MSFTNTAKLVLMSGIALTSMATLGHAFPLIEPSATTAVMSTIPDPLWDLAVGSTSAAWGSLVASPLESPDSSLRLPTPRPYSSSNREEEESITAPLFGLQLGIYDALLSLSSHSGADEAITGQVLRAIVVGAALTSLELWDLAKSSKELSPKDGDVEDIFRHIWWYRGLWQACALQSTLFLVACLPLHQALVESDGWQPYAAGALAGMVASLVSHPFGIVQQRLWYQCSMDYRVDQSYPVVSSSNLRQAQAQESSQARVRDRLADRDQQNTHLTTMIVDGAPFILRKVKPPPSGFTNSTSIFFKRTQEASSSMGGSSGSSTPSGVGGSWNDAVPIQPLPENSMIGDYYSNEEENVDWGDMWPSSQLEEKGNPVAAMMGEIVQEEGPTALFSGALRRCIIAIPKFGSALALHHALHEVLSQAGWLTNPIIPP